MKTSIITVAVIVLTATAAPASAVQLVTNGGFETGSFSGWTQFGSLGQTNVNAADAISGGFGGRFSPNSNGGIFQTIATVAGQAYVFSFDLQHRANQLTPNNSFSASFGGVTLVSLSNLASVGPMTYTFSPIATGVSTLIRFTFRDARDTPANRYSLDDVSVVAVTRPDVVPEPGSWAMLVLGFALTGLGLRRRRVVVA